jgi:hypothetical protein
MPRFKLQVQDDETRPDVWHDVKNEQGELLTFDKEIDARTRLKELYPVLVKLEEFAAGPKRTRVLLTSPYADIDDERDK